MTLSLKHLIDWLFTEPYQKISQEQQAQQEIQKGMSWRSAQVLILSAVILSIQEYWLTSSVFHFLLGQISTIAPALEGMVDWMLSEENRRLSDLCYWAGGLILTYWLIPVLWIKFVWREKLGEFGWRLGGMKNGIQIYLLMAMVMLPVVYVASLRTSFLEQYPFYKIADEDPLWPRFFIWQCFYATQFIALEFFFRGFMVHGLKKDLGVHALFVMMVPYCMIHFGKPMPETFAAIIAGIVLGWMSLKSRNVLPGAALHIAVAWIMDFLALSSSL